MRKKFNHGVSSEHLLQIGDITVSFALLEFQFRKLAESLLDDHPKIAMVITAELSFKSLRSLIKCLYKEKYGMGEDYEKIKKFNTRALKIEEERNKITHSFWGVGNKINTITRLKITAKEKKGFNFYTEQVSITELSNISEKIKELSFEVYLLWAKFMNIPLKDLTT